MGILGSLIGSVTSTGVTEAANGIGDAAIKMREALTGELTPDAKAKILDHLADIDSAVQRVNEAQAKSASFFVAGSRPSLMWVCTISVGLYYIPRFILGMFFWGLQVWRLKTLMPMPEMGIQDVLGLVGLLLGGATLRTYEKTQGVHNEH